jgi:hypothetical protein
MSAAPAKDRAFLSGSAVCFFKPVPSSLGFRSFLPCHMHSFIPSPTLSVRGIASRFERRSGVFISENGLSPALLARLDVLNIERQLQMKRRRKRTALAVHFMKASRD